MGKEKKSRSDKIIAIVIVLIVAAFVATLVWKAWDLFHDDGEKAKQEEVKMEEVDKLIHKNIEQRYPSTPTAVVQLYASISKELHAKDVTKKQIDGLHGQIRLLFDEELLSKNDYEKHLKKLNEEIENYKKQKMTIVRYVTEDSKKVKVYEGEDGRDYTKVGLTYSIKKGSKWLKSNEQVILRKDEENRWKILGVESVSEEESEDDEE